MIYSAEVTKRVTNPQNAGSMDSSDPEVGIGLVGAPACGDVLQLFIRVRNGTIIEAKFQAFGCGSAIASSQFATEQLNGLALNEAKKINNREIFEYLALPPVKLHCSILAEEAVHAAIEDYKAKNRLENNG
jgi:nitrogen fixation NifU-like protein